MSDRRYLKSGGVIIALISIIYFFANLQKVIIPGAAFNELQQMFALDAAGVTKLSAIFLGVYAVAQLFIGVLADRFGGAKVIIAGGAVFCIGSLLSAFDSSLPMLYFSRMLTGIGAASIYLSMVKEISRVAGNAMPMVLGVVMIIGYSGAIAGASPFIAGVEKFGYVPMMLATGAATILFYAVYVFSAFRDNFPPVNKEVKFNLESYLVVFKSRQNVCLIFAIGISFGIYFAMQSTIGKKFMEDFCGMSAKSAGIVLTVTMLIASFNGLIVANISRLLGNRRMPVILFCGFGCLASTGIILLTVCFNLNAWIAVAGIILMAFSGNITPVYVASLKESNADNRFGTVICVGNSLAYGISAVLSDCAGKMMDIFPPEITDGIKVYGQNSYMLIFGVLMILGGSAAFLTLLIRESNGKQIIW